MDWINQLLGIKKKQMPQAQVAQPMPQQAPPDITYNPNPKTNIPYSTHDMGQVAAGNRYVKNPTSPEFLGVDPKIWGFPADETVRNGPQEDDGLVQARQRTMPLSDVGRGQLFVNPNSMTIGGAPRPRRRSSLEDLLNF